MTGDERELRTAWQCHVGVGADADRWFEHVVARHREPHRHYHDLRHVRWVVRHVRHLAIQAADPPLDPARLDIVVAAAFFHDTVYDPQRTDNEPASARLARRALGEIGWPASAVDRVAGMVEATASHESTDVTAGVTTDAATDVLLAADLGVLAADPSRYGDYVRSVRREYAHLDEDAWRSGRASFVRAMLERAHIFPEPLDLAAWERRARANLTAELAALD